MNEQTTESDYAARVLAYMLDESDDIAGTRLNLGDEQPKVWVHTTEQVREWLRERLPAALRTPPGQETADDHA